MLVGAFTLIAAPRVLLAVFYPWFEGDGRVYARIATNILQNGCVSLSPPALGACEPHWGGNQLPGYPAVIAGSHVLFGPSGVAPLVVQSFAFAAAATYLIHALRVAGTPLAVGAIVALVLAVSPSLIGWSRMLLTEAMSSAAVLWIVAALTLSIGQRRLRVVEVGVAIAAGVLMRYSVALSLAAVIVVAWRLYPPAGALRRVVVIALIALTPFAGWTLRNVAQGLSPLPPAAMTRNGTPAPAGMLAWLATWVTNQYELPTSLWPVLTEDYRSLRPPASADPRALELVAALPPAGAVPAALDAAFADLAAAEKLEHRFEQSVVLPLRRIGNLWGSPFPSMGLPLELPAGTRVVFESAWRAGDLPEWMRIVIANAPQAAMKAAVSLWRYATLAMLGIVAWAILRRRLQNGVLATLTGASIGVALAFTAAFAFTPFIETRYLVPVLVWLDVITALAFGTWLMRARVR